MRYRDEDPLNSARGLAIALLVSLPLFGIVVGAGVNCYGSLKKAGLIGQETDLGSSYRAANGGR